MNKNIEALGLAATVPPMQVSQDMPHLWVLRRMLCMLLVERL